MKWRVAFLGGLFIVGLWLNIIPDNMELKVTATGENDNIIRIVSDEELVSTAHTNGWKGTGTSADPFLIKELSGQGFENRINIAIENTTMNIEISNCTCEILLRDSQNIVIKNNTIIGDKRGILLYESSNVMIDNNTFINSTMNIEIWRDSDYLDTIQFSGNNTINGRPYYMQTGKNRLTVPKDSGAVLLIDCMDIFIYGLEIEGINNCIALYDCTLGLVRNNTCKNLTDAGISLSYCNNIIVSFNEIMQTGTYGIYCQRSENIDMNNNSISKASRCGIAVFNSNYCKVDNNTIFNNSMKVDDNSGLIMGSSRGCSISNNEIHHNNGNGMAIDGSNEIIVEYNHIHDNNKKGISFFSTDLSEVRYNLIINCDGGIKLYGSSYSYIHHNDFITDVPSLRGEVDNFYDQNYYGDMLRVGGPARSLDGIYWNRSYMIYEEYWDYDSKNPNEKKTREMDKNPLVLPLYYTGINFIAFTSPYGFTGSTITLGFVYNGSDNVKASIDLWWNGLDDRITTVNISTTNGLVYDFEYNISINETRNLNYILHFENSSGPIKIGPHEIFINDNIKPIIDIVEKVRANTTDPVVLSAKNCYDNIGIVNYTWKVLQLSRYEGYYYTEVVELTFDVEMIWDVTLTITDTEGNEASETVKILISDEPITCLIGPVMNEKGVPLKGINVSISGTFYFPDMTNETGYVELIVQRSKLGDTITILFEKEGFEKLTLDAEVTINGTVFSEDIVLLNEKKDIVSNDFYGDILFVVAVLVCLLLVLTVLSVILFIVWRIGPIDFIQKRDMARSGEE